MVCTEADAATGTVHRPAFVLHDHRRPRPQHDPRLAEDGVLRSWALPRGLPTSPSADRLAIAVPDHDLGLLEYTDEHTSIADTGWWERQDRDERRTVFVLHGRTGAHRYALIRTGGTEDSGLLLHLVVGSLRRPERPASPAVPS